MPGPRARRPTGRLSLPPEAVAYIGGGSNWSVSCRLICLGALPQPPRSTGISDECDPAGLMRQARLQGGVGLVPPRFEWARVPLLLLLCQEMVGVIVWSGMG